jgi:hypothetical protein
MKFEIRITDLDEGRLKSLLKFLEGQQEVKALTDRKLTKAERMLRKVSPEAPYGLKKDGTPRKKPGRPPNKYKF